MPFDKLRANGVRFVLYPPGRCASDKLRPFDKLRANGVRFTP
jgi:hypothetical protein